MRDTQVLTRYKAWADKLFLSALSTLSDAELTAPQPIVFGSLIRTLNHSFEMDYVWKCHLLGKPHGVTSRNSVEYPAMVELMANQCSIDKWYVEYADSITDEELKEVIKFEFIDGGTGQMNRRDVLLHVVNHSTYHRGHAAGMLYQMNVSPPTTDLPVFLREVGMEYNQLA